MIDKDYTSSMLGMSNVAHSDSLFTEAEVDHLLFGDDDVNEDFPTRLAEEAYLRSTGLLVDLSTQGSADHCVYQSSGNQTAELLHDSIAIRYTEGSQRRYSMAMKDVHTVPKVTPQDTNIAVKSLTWTGGRVRGVHGEGDRIAEKDGPIEASFMAQVHVAQVMDRWGADVNGIIEFINSKWGITYADSLVRCTDVAPLEDVDRYIATGGRPTPQTYVSANVMSAYQVDQRVAVSTESLGATSAFWSRASTLSQFIMMMTNFCHGRGAICNMVFHANPAYVSYFDTTQYCKLSYSVTESVPMSRFRYMLPESSDYDQFVSVRQASAYAIKAAEMKSQVAIKVGVKCGLKSVASLFSPSDVFNRMEQNTGVMQYGRIIPSIREPHVETAAPSKVTTILMASFHGKSIDDMYGVAYVTGISFLLLTSLCSSTDDFTRAYGSIKSVPQISVLLTNVNVVRAATEVPEFKALLESHGKAPALSFLFFRTLNHVKAEILSEMEVMTAESSAGRIVRPLAVLGSQLARKVVPFKYVKKGAAQMSVSVPTSGLIGVNMLSVLKSDRKMTSEGKEVEKNSFKFALSTIRNRWTSYYFKKVQTLLAMHLAMSWEGDNIRSMIPPYGPWGGNKQLVYAGMLHEICHYSGVEMAYRFASVTHHKLLPSTSESKEMTISEYLDYLSTTNAARVSGSLRVNMHIEKFHQESAQRRVLNEKASWIAQRFPKIASCQAVVKEMIMNTYSVCAPLVESTMAEMIVEDCRIAVDMTDEESGSHEVAGETRDAASREEPSHMSVGEGVADGPQLSAMQGLMARMEMESAASVSTDDEWFVLFKASIEELHLMSKQNNPRAVRLVSEIVTHPQFTQDVVNAALTRGQIHGFKKAISQCDGNPSPLFDNDDVTIYRKTLRDLHTAVVGPQAGNQSVMN